jgi:hypothetical protein
MFFTFKSEQYGTTVEMNFEAVTLDEIRNMFDQFLRGSGFYFVEDDDNVSTKEQNVDTSEEYAPQTDMSYRPGGLTVEQSEHPLDIYERAYFAGKKDGIDETEAIAKLKERNNCEAGATRQTAY